VNSGLLPISDNTTAAAKSPRLRTDSDDPAQSIALSGDQR
jgi:hypothetical protein